MKNEVIRAGISDYKAETANIRYFLREPKTIQQWQDWLWRRVPVLKTKTVKMGPSAIQLGQGWKDISCRYADLLTYLCMVGDVERVRGEAVTVYRWVGD
jgi:hypothetical protein